MTCVFCDWGTTNLRAFLLEDGEVSEVYASENGLTRAKDLGFPKVLGEVLTHFDAPLNTPIFLSGMVGSKNGWKESPYVSTPAGVEELKNNFVTIEEIPNVKILGGVSTELKNGKKDVIRGEEVQVFGILEKFPHAEKVCLPGTHSKWVEVQNKSIVSFSTWMTGDLFNSLSQYTIFKEQISSNAFCQNSFKRGLVTAEESGPLLNAAFHLRTDYLFGEISSNQFHSYLSGFLIGTEVKDAFKGSDEVIVCGSEKMMELYSLALNHFGIMAVEFPASEATVLGMQKITQD